MRGEWGRRMRGWWVLTLLLSLLPVMLAGAFGGEGKKGRLGNRPPPVTQEQEEETNPDPEVMGAFVPQRANRAAMEARGFLATGLMPVYPTGFDCPRVTSPFASPFRTDGSSRTQRFFQGLHGGMDITQPEFTPLLAMADGEVILKHEGEEGGIGGYGLWLRHAPADTGLDKYVFVEYKHIVKLPDLPIGARVLRGQVVAQTGNSGTTGGHYGDEGLYHLHMTAYWSDSPEFKFKRVLLPVGAQWLDPIALLRGGPLDSHAAAALAPTEKQVVIPFMSSDGRFFPAATRLVWPYACTPR